MLYVCLFLPASISILVSERIRKEKRNISELIIPYLGYTFMIATIMNMIVYFISDAVTPWYDISTFTFAFTLQYTWLSLVIAAVLPCLVYIVSKVVQINIEVKEKKKDDKKVVEDRRENYKMKH